MVDRLLSGSGWEHLVSMFLFGYQVGLVVDRVPTRFLYPDVI